MSNTVLLVEDVINGPIVHVEDRRFPGIVIQGDSLANLVDLASEVVRLFDAGEAAEARETANELHGLLLARLNIYTDVVTRMEEK